MVFYYDAGTSVRGAHGSARAVHERHSLGRRIWYVVLAVRIDLARKEKELIHGLLAAVGVFELGVEYEPVGREEGIEDGFDDRKLVAHVPGVPFQGANPPRVGLELVECGLEVQGDLLLFHHDARYEAIGAFEVQLTNIFHHLQGGALHGQHVDEPYSAAGFAHEQRRLEVALAAVLGRRVGVDNEVYPLLGRREAQVGVHVAPAYFLKISPSLSSK